MKRVAFIVNGPPNGALGVRARSFARELASRFEIHLRYREPNKIRAILDFLSFLTRTRPDRRSTPDPRSSSSRATPQRPRAFLVGVLHQGDGFLRRVNDIADESAAIGLLLH